jgi:hypothetical protein
MHLLVVENHLSQQVRVVHLWPRFEAAGSSAPLVRSVGLLKRWLSCAESSGGRRNPCLGKVSKPFVGSSLRHQLMAEQAPGRYGDEKLAVVPYAEYYQLKVFRND